MKLHFHETPDLFPNNVNSKHNKIIVRQNYVIKDANTTVDELKPMFQLTFCMGSFSDSNLHMLTL